MHSLWNTQTPHQGSSKKHHFFPLSENVFLLHSLTKTPICFPVTFCKPATYPPAIWSLCSITNTMSCLIYRPCQILFVTFSSVPGVTTVVSEVVYCQSKYTKHAGLLVNLSRSRSRGDAQQYVLSSDPSIQCGGAHQPTTKLMINC